MSLVITATITTGTQRVTFTLNGRIRKGIGVHLYYRIQYYFQRNSDITINFTNVESNYILRPRDRIKLTEYRICHILLLLI